MNDPLRLSLIDPRDLPALQQAFAEELGAPVLTEAATSRLERGDGLQLAQVLLAIPAAALAAVSLAERPALVAALRRVQERLRGRGVAVQLPGQPSVPLEDASIPHLLDAADLVDDPEPAWDVFLAYASPDLARVEALHAALQGHGLRVFRDRTGVRPGQDWTFAILNAQRASRATVVALSVHWTGALHLRDEIQRALQLRRKHGHWVLPVYLDGFPSDEDLPPGLKLIQGVDASGGIAPAARTVAERVLELAVRS